MQPAAMVLSLDDDFVRSLPGDPRTDNTVRRVARALWSAVAPTPTRAPRLLAWVPEVAEMLGLPPGIENDTKLVEVLGGARVPEGARPYAARYGGHQFGHWAGQLGDGRAIVLGEMRARDGSRQELQLKGAGRTPYSRHADGRAVLRSSIRELVCSEAMHHLGVPTTRALSLVATGEEVERDLLYDGHPRMEPGAVVCRVAPSFLRFGNFEILAAEDEHDLLARLCDYAVERFYPELGRAHPGDDDAARARRTAAMFEEVARRTAVLIAHWMRVGFVHGVMNTDNMSLLGLTIDYGPFGFLDDFDPSWTPNTTDAHGRRYRYAHQPQVALWNLSRLAGALLPVVGDREALERGLDAYREAFDRAQRDGLARKLGLRAVDDDETLALCEDLYAALAAVEIDHTLFFRALADGAFDGGARIGDGGDGGGVPGAADDLLRLRPALYAEAPGEGALRPLLDWLPRYRAALGARGLAEPARTRTRRAACPAVVPRNYLLQQTIDAAEAGDLGPLHTLLDAIRTPYDDPPPERAPLTARRPDWARSRPGCSALSCSS
jgi:uncharacterized protein YdiU (UPF0061 family)